MKIWYYFFLLYCPIVLADIHYQSSGSKSELEADQYAKTDKSIARYLAYRDIASLLHTHVKGNKALDFGAGTGISTQFLMQFSFDVTAVDVSKAMVDQFKISCPNVPCYLIKNNQIPLKDSDFDLVFSSFVILELKNEKEIIKYLQEARRILKNNGTLLIVTASEKMYTKNWLLYNADYQENRNLKSGDIAKIYLNDAKIEFTDYFWTEKDILDLIHKVGFEVVEISHPLGKSHEPFAWRDEKYFSPFLIIVAKKI